MVTRILLCYLLLASLTLNTAFLVWHFYIGTENPIAACVPCYAIGTAMTEIQVRDIKNSQIIGDKKLEDRVSSGLGAN